MHVDEVCKHLLRYFTVFYNIRDKINKSLARTIYFTCINSVIKYGIEIYGATTKSNLHRIQVLQNKLLKVLTKKEFRYSTNQLHIDMRILKVEDIYSHSILQFVYKCLNKKVPKKFHKNFSRLGDTHDHDTRNRHLLRTPQFDTEIGRKSTNCIGASLWNTIEMDTQVAKSINVFKRKLFTELHRKYSLGN